MSRRRQHRWRGQLFALFGLASLSALVGLALLAGVSAFGLATPVPTGAVLGLVSDPGPAEAAASAPGSATARGSATLGPIYEAGTALVPTRPAIVLPQPTAGVAVRAASRTAVPTTGTAVFLGDSYTTGYNGAGLGARGWPRLVSANHGWKTVNLAVAGTGFINPGWTGQAVGTQVSAAIRAKPAIVFIAAGHNDSRWSASSVAAAADKVIDRIHAALPGTTLVILAPIWPTGSPPSRCLTLRDHLRQKAVAVGAMFIDPLAEGWFAGSAEREIGPDGIHPTDAGHSRMATFVLRHLR
ncbi:MAG: SGNH/GDSL hydrolase family protein [Chloroflexota bacterium]